MTEDVLIPKMKRLEKKQRKIKIPLLNIVLILFCTLLIIGSTFINIDLKHYYLPLEIFSNKSLTTEDFIYNFNIIPQIPVIMFICATLGKRMAITSTVIYILLGLCSLPLFALGGGIRYIAQFGFGYILAYIPAVAIAGNIIQKKYSFKNMIIATYCGVLTIHLCGIIYMSIIALMKHEGAAFIYSWICAQSGLKILYDIALSFICILIGKYLHSAIKFILE